MCKSHTGTNSDNTVPILGADLYCGKYHFGFEQRSFFWRSLMTAFEQRPSFRRSLEFLKKMTPFWSEDLLIFLGSSLEFLGGI